MVSGPIRGGSGRRKIPRVSTQFSCGTRRRVRWSAAAVSVFPFIVFAAVWEIRPDPADGPDVERWSSG